MSDYHDIITAAFPPDKARRILQREQQQRGIVASPVQHPSPRPTPQPTQRIRPVIVQQLPTPAPPVVIYHTQPQANTSQHTGTIGRVALLFLFSWFGV